MRGCVSKEGPPPNAVLREEHQALAAPVREEQELWLKLMTCLFAQYIIIPYNTSTYRQMVRHG